jgi:hypothetical protein
MLEGPMEAFALCGYAGPGVLSRSYVLRSPGLAVHGPFAAVIECRRG